MQNDVLFEIGLEELPARFINESEKMLRKHTIQWLKEQRIAYSDVLSFSTPRRLAVLIKDVASSQTNVSKEVKGPQLKIAKNDDGEWTKAAVGFTKGQGLTTDDIYVKNIKEIAYTFVDKKITGKKTMDVLPSFRQIIEGLTFPQTMRWGNETVRYARPIRWLVALYGEEVIPFEIASVRTRNKTFGHRFLGSELVLDSPSDYYKLKDQFVIISQEERQSIILASIKSIENNENFRALKNEPLLYEVSNLVEYPTVFCGQFKNEFLDLPKEVLTASMIEHQRYFPVEDKQGNLAPYFIGVRNGDKTAIDTVVRGNEKVLHARLQDARFFYEEDQKQPLTYYLDKLDYVVFQEKMGTVKDKTNRLSILVEELSHVLNSDTITRKHALRAATLSKFDLTTDMVNEFTELQGIIGEIYALHYGEEIPVATAIKEHYLPIHANGDLPETETGALLSISDKLDTIIGCIGVGLIPSGSQDPYGLRRKALGILRIVIDRKWEVPVEQLLNITIDMYEKQSITDFNLNGLTAEINAFFKLRASYMLRELNIEQDVIDAVLHQQIGNLPYTIEKAKILSEKRQDDAFKTVHEALMRVLHLADKTNDTTVHPNILETESEKELWHAYQNAYTAFQHADIKKDAQSCIESIASLAEPIHMFFEHNMVMADNKEIRENRLALIQQIVQFIKQFADLSLIEWKQHF
ncbi:MAG TPA: glycine--tRNA ligase subunit beta [Bacillota bacterium]|nr:glycine--tRNA ligase subunit beta [Bacillota bacterium]